jgi:LysR family hydrogen peroxide-inducible transcriptional activator
MNIQQLEYIVAVDEHRHFQKAADACFVTPATLSMMVKKLEQELNIILFDRSRQPVIPTETGAAIIEKAKIVLHHIAELKDTAKYASEEIAGEIRLAIIPTLAPYLSHLFLPKFLKQYPKLRIKLYEWNTTQIVEALKHNRVDIGIAATPLEVPEITETHLFYEKLMAYTAKGFEATDKTFIAPEDIDLSRLWLLSEEHCLRSQVVNLCSLKKMQEKDTPLDFEAGSIETLLNIVGINEGITIIPELVIPTLPPKRKACVRPFQAPIPVREISLLTYRHFVKEKLLTVLRQEILKAVSPIIKASPEEKKVVAI